MLNDPNLGAHLGEERGRQVWSLSYTVRNGSSTWETAMGAVDAETGRLLYLHLDAATLFLDDSAGEPQPEEAAKLRAWQLVQALYPQEAAAFLRLAPFDVLVPEFALLSESAGAYLFAFSDYQDGVPVAGNMVLVAVDKYTLDPVGVSSIFTPGLEMPAKGVGISPEEAEARFRSTLSPQLMYVPSRVPGPFRDRNQTVGLYYQMGVPGTVDAQTGEFLGFGRGYPSEEMGPPRLSFEDLPSADVEPVAAPSLPLDERGAMALARHLLGAPSELEFDVSPDFWYEGGGGIRVSGYSAGYDGQVTLDGKTGLILDAYRSPDRSHRTAPGSEDEPGDMTWTPERKEKAKQAAAAIVRRYFGPIADRLKLLSDTWLDAWHDEMPAAHFFFARHENGIPVENEGVQVTIDWQHLTWINISSTWTDGLLFADPAGAISAQDAIRLFMWPRQAKLVYEMDQPMPYFFVPMDRPDSSPQKARLSYRLVKPDDAGMFAAIDALTGKEVPASPAGYAQATVPASGHWAEREMRYLVAQWVLPAAAVNPDAPLSRGEALYMLLRGAQDSYGLQDRAQMPYADVAIGDPLFASVLQAHSAGILRPEGENPSFGGAQPVTRAEFALWMARSLNLGALTRSGLEARTGFGDLDGLSHEERNAVILLEALGIVKPAAAFRGNVPLTQAEAAVMLVRLMRHQRLGR